MPALPVLPPSANPCSVNLPYIAFLKPFPHSQLLIHAAYGMHFRLDRENTLFVLLLPLLERRPANEFLSSERNAWKFRNVSHVAVKKPVDLRLGATEFGGDFSSGQD